mgnify:CR=1 FL=1
MFDFLKNGMGMSLVRHALTWGSGVLVAKGTISADMATQVVSLAVGAAGLMLSAQDKKAKQTEFFGLENSLDKLTAQKDQEQTEWQKVQQELSELRIQNQQQKEMLDRPIDVSSLQQRANEFGNRGPQARYQHVSVANNSGFMMSDKSRQKMKDVHPLLTQVVETAMSLSVVDFKVTEGVRSLERQAELLADGRSWVKTSKHQVDPVSKLGHACDVMALPTPDGSWDWEYYEQINDAMQAAAKIHNARITWGGGWAVRDGCHFQIDGETK